MPLKKSFSAGILWLLALLTVLHAHGQKVYTLKITSDLTKLTENSSILKFKDSIQLSERLRETRYRLVRKGHLLASIDTSLWSEQTCRAYIYAGPVFKQIELKSELVGTSNTFLDQLIKRIGKMKVSFSPVELKQLLEDTENALLTNGYPFGSVRLKNLNWPEEGRLSATLVIDPGTRYTFGELLVKGDSSISAIYITSLLNIHPGDRFDEEKLRSITARIAQVPFLKQVKNFELLFTEKQCVVYLYLKAQPVSSANGTVGLQPNPTTNRVGLAGELNLKLLNILKRGEQLHLNWRSIQDQTQSMQLKLTYPFLFKSPFGIDAQLHLYKKDTTYLELKNLLGVQYQLKKGGVLKAFYQHYSSSLLNGSDNSTFGKVSNINSNAYGISLSKRVLDYIPNPSKGYIFYLEGSIGNRKSKDNDSSMSIRTTTGCFAFHTEWFMPVAKRHVVRFASVNEFYYAPEIYQNELSRFGGLMSLRGFNEDELLASAKSIVTIEYRYLLDRNSAFFIFYDQGYYENRSLGYQNDHPYGIGGGLSFGTNLGIFSLSYALGSQQGNPLLLKNGKIHFGYIAYF